MPGPYFLRTPDYDGPQWFTDVELLVSVFEITWFGVAAWRWCVVALLFAAYGLYLYHGRRKEASTDVVPASTPVARRLEYAEAPTIRLSDTQRIDRLHRIVTLKTGEHANLKDMTFGRLPQLRVILKGIDHDAGQDVANIEVDLGGAVANGGAAVKELKDNHFLVPRATLDEQRCAIHYFCGRSDAVSFLQIKVRRIDPVEGSAAVDVLHVRGRWADGTTPAAA